MIGSRRIIPTYLAAALASAAGFGMSSIWSSAALAQDAGSNKVIALDTDQISQQLLDPAANQNMRDEAARRLLARKTPAANRTLLSALADLNAGAQLSVAQALADNGTTDEAFINPLFAAMGTNLAVTDKAAAALTNYRTNDTVLTRFLDLAGNRQRSATDPVRLASIRSLGAFVEKRSADLLVRILRDPDDAAAARARAGEALAAMTGISEFDAGGWANWWGAQSPKTPAAFHNDMLERLAAVSSLEKSRNTSISRELQTMVHDFYRSTPQSGKESLLLRFLRSPEPETRVAAVDQVSEDVLNALAVPASVMDTVRALIDDSSPQVRRSVAVAIQTTNDKSALDLFLAQLSHETDPSVRAVIALSLGPMGDAKAGPALLKLLDDESRLVEKNAALSLKGLGQKIREANPDLTMQVATKLRAMVERPGNNVNDDDLRIAAVQALAPLKQRDMSTLYYKLLDPRQQPAPIRRAALNALGEIGDPQSSGPIITALTDPDSGVQFEAVRALGRVGPSPDQLNPLRPLLDPRQQNDKSIRDESYNVLAASLPSLSTPQLAQWADFFRQIEDRDHRILVNKALADRLVTSNSPEDLSTLAGVRQQIADDYVAQKDWDSAAQYYELALDYLKTRQAVGPTRLMLTEQYLKTLLNSGKFQKGIDFASSLLTGDPIGNQQIVGPAIIEQIEGLQKSEKADDLRKAQSLIDLTNKMPSPLADRYLDELKKRRTSIDSRLEEVSRPATTAPRSEIETVSIEWFDRIRLV